MRFSLNTVIFRDRDIEEVLGMIKRYGYDGVEIAWIPREHPFYMGKDLNITKIKSSCETLGLPVAAVCPFYPAEYNLAHTSASKRKNAIDYVRRIIEATAELGAKIVVVVPSAVFVKPTGEFKEEWKSSVSSLAELGYYAQDHGVTLAIEPITRFLTHFVTRIEQALKLVKDAEAPGLGVLADVFHMNIEEKTIGAALRQAKNLLVHVHVSDSNNCAPGSGHLDFGNIYDVLNDIQYNGFISAELGVDFSEAEESAEATIKYLRNLRA